MRYIVIALLALAGCSQARTVDRTVKADKELGFEPVKLTDKQRERIMRRQWEESQRILQEREQRCEECQRTLKRYGPIPGCSTGLENVLSSVRRLLSVYSPESDPAVHDLMIDAFRLECYQAELAAQIKRDSP